MPATKSPEKREDSTDRWPAWWRDWPVFKLDRNGVADPSQNRDEAHLQFWKPMERAAWTYEIVRRLCKPGTLNKPKPIPDADLKQIAALPPFPDLSDVQRSQLRHILMVNGKTRPVFVMGWHPQFVEGKYSSPFPAGYFDLEAGDNAVLLLVQEWLHEQRRIRGIERVGKGKKQSKNQNQEYKPVHWNHLELVEETLEALKPSDSESQRKQKNSRAKNKSKCKGKLGAIGEESWRLVLLVMSLAGFQLGTAPGSDSSRIPSGWEGKFNFTMAEMIWIFTGRQPEPTPDSQPQTKAVEASTANPDLDEVLTKSLVDQVLNSSKEGVSAAEVHTKNLESCTEPFELALYTQGAMGAAWFAHLVSPPASPGMEPELPRFSEDEIPYPLVTQTLEELCQAGELTKEKANDALDRLRSMICQKALALQAGWVNSAG